MVPVHGFDYLGSPATLGIFDHFTQVEVLDWHMVVAVSVAATDRIEICGHERLTQGILIFQITAGRLYRALDQHDRVIRLRTIE